MGNTDKNGSVSISIRYCMRKCIAILEKSKASPYSKAMLARIRNSVGMPFSRNAELLALIYENFPEGNASAGEKLTYEEKAIMTALQMYALYNQGGNAGDFDSGGSIEASSDKNCRNMGASLRVLRRLDTDDSKATDRRFNALITAGDFEEFTYHLRHLIKLLKSRTSGAAIIDFAQLALDLYWFDRGQEERTRLSWAREYYRVEYKENDEKEKKEND